MHRVHNLTFGCVVLGLVFAMCAYIMATQDHLLVWSGNRKLRFTRDASPMMFWLPALTMAFVGFACWMAAWYLHFRRGLAGAPPGLGGLPRPLKIMLLCFGVLVVVASLLARWLV